jgi:hypothetical protein
LEQGPRCPADASLACCPQQCGDCHQAARLACLFAAGSWARRCPPGTLVSCRWLADTPAAAALPRPSCPAQDVEKVAKVLVNLANMAELQQTDAGSRAKAAHHRTALFKFLEQHADRCGLSPVPGLAPLPCARPTLASRCSHWRIQLLSQQAWGCAGEGGGEAGRLLTAWLPACVWCSGGCRSGCLACWQLCSSPAPTAHGAWLCLALPRDAGRLARAAAPQAAAGRVLRVPAAAGRAGGDAGGQPRHHARLLPLLPQQGAWGTQASVACRAAACRGCLGPGQDEGWLGAVRLACQGRPSAAVPARRPAMSLLPYWLVPGARR